MSDIADHLRNHFEHDLTDEARRLLAKQVANGIILWRNSPAQAKWRPV